MSPPPSVRDFRKWVRYRLINLLAPDYLRLFTEQLRKAEYYRNCKHGPLSKIRYVFIERRLAYLSRLNGFTIPQNVLGPGVSIAHSGTIVINNRCRIGKNCRIHTCVNIGTAKDTTDCVPVIGDNVYIGPGAKLFGKIVIADDCVIGANAVVNKSFPVPGTKIMGVPARGILPDG